MSEQIFKKSLGQIGYEAWKKEWEPRSTIELVSWDNLSELDKAAMNAAAVAVMNAVFEAQEKSTCQPSDNTPSKTVEQPETPKYVHTPDLAGKIQALIDAGHLEWGPIPANTTMTTNPAQ